MPTTVKRQLATKKVLYAVFFSNTGLVRAIKLKGQKTVTANCFKNLGVPPKFQNDPRIWKGILQNVVLEYYHSMPHRVAARIQITKGPML
ncbi:hypothetical protein TNCV_1224061 [Trichonephila clavipes]|nr:hypothetical protein TNCV_1224061 [Trichonephila clavipes]